MERRAFLRKVYKAARIESNASLPDYNNHFMDGRVSEYFTRNITRPRRRRQRPVEPKEPERQLTSDELQGIELIELVPGESDTEVEDKDASSDDQPTKICQSGGFTTTCAQTDTIKKNICKGCKDFLDKNQIKLKRDGNRPVPLINNFF